MKLGKEITNAISRLGMTHAAFFLGVTAVVATRQISWPLVTYFAVVFLAHALVSFLAYTDTRNELQSRITAVEADLAQLRTDLSKLNLVFGMSQRTASERASANAADAISRAQAALRHT